MSSGGELFLHGRLEFSPVAGHVCGVCHNQHGIVHSNQPGLSPTHAINKVRFERPQIGRRKKICLVQWYIAQDMQSPGTPNPREFLTEEPNREGHGSPYDQAVGDVVRLVYVGREICRPCAEYVQNHERAERDHVGRSSEHECPTPMSLAFISEESAAPEAVCENIHGDEFTSPWGT
jgi:hypothetical protein